MVALCDKKTLLMNKTITCNGPNCFSCIHRADAASLQYQGILPQINDLRVGKKGIGANNDGRLNG